MTRRAPRILEAGALGVALLGLVSSGCAGRTGPDDPLRGVGRSHETVAEPSTPAAHEPGPADHADPAHAHHGGPLVHRFEDAAEWSKEFDDPARDAWQKPGEVVEKLGVERGMTVVDLGAGTGYFLAHLSKAVGESGRVIGLDIEQSMVDFMLERAEREQWGNVEARVVEGDDPRLAPGSVDRILIVDTWHHIPDRPAYARKLFEALADGGMLAVVDFDLDSERGPPARHRLAPTAVIEELRAGGLRAAVVDEDLPDQYIVIGAR